MRWIIGSNALARQAAYISQMERFETQLLATDANPAALTYLSGTWIDRVHDRRPPKTIVVDTVSSDSPTYGDQDGTAYNAHFSCM